MTADHRIRPRHLPTLPLVSAPGPFVSSITCDEGRQRACWWHMKQAQGMRASSGCQHTAPAQRQLTARLPRPRELYSLTRSTTACGEAAAQRESRNDSS